MNHTVVSLASLATVGSAMLLWKLLTGEHGADGEAEQDTWQEANADLNAELSCSSYDYDAPGSVAAAEASAAWTDASSQLADDENVAGSSGQVVLSGERPEQQPSHDVSSLQPAQQSNLQASESFLSAASLEDDTCEVSSAVTCASGSPAPQRSAAHASIESFESSLACVGSGSTTEEPAATGLWQLQGPEFQQQEVASAEEQQVSEQRQQQQQQQQQEEDVDEGAGCAVFGDTAAAIADSSGQRRRHSSSEQVAFGPIEPCFCLGGLLGDWPGHDSSMTRGSTATPGQQVDFEQATNPTGADVEQRQAGQLQLQKQLSQQQQQQPMGAGCSTEPDGQQNTQLQEQKLQPLNLAAADSVFDQQHAMTDTLWASLRTVEAGQGQSGVSAHPGTCCLPPLPRPASASAAVTAAPASGVVEGDSGSDSEDNCDSAFALPIEVMSAVGSSSTAGSSNAAAGAHAVHSRQASRAISGSGSLLGALADWPSIQLQASLPAEGKAGESTGLTTAAIIEQADRHQQQQEVARTDGYASANTITAQQAQHPELAASDSNQQPEAGVQHPLDGLLAVDQQERRGLVQKDAEHVRKETELTCSTIWQQALASAKEHSQHTANQSCNHGSASRIDTQQQLAGDILPASQHSQQQLDLQLRVRAQPNHVQQPAAQDGESTQRHQQHLQLQPEFTLPASAGSDRGSVNADGSAYAPGSPRSRQQQQQHCKQLMQQEQQKDGDQLKEQSPVDAADTAAGSSGAAAAATSGRHTANSTLLQTVKADEVGGGDSTSPGRPQLLTQPAKDSNSSSSSNTTADAGGIMADLAAGLTAPRSWRPPMAAHSSVIGPTHSKLSIMTTAADTGINRPKSSSIDPPDQQQQGHTDRALSSDSSVSGTSKSSNEAAASVADGCPWLRLVVLGGPAAGKCFHTSDRTAELVVGRSPLVWAAISDQEISGKHACLSWSDTQNCWQVADAGSLNGTSLNGRSISRPGRQPGQTVALKHGDRLELGSITSAVVECEPALQQSDTAAAAPAAPLSSPVQQPWQQHREHSDLLNQTRKARSSKQQQQHEFGAGQLQHSQQQIGNHLLPLARQPQTWASDSRYNTWTAGHPHPTSDSSIAGGHKQSLESPPPAATPAMHHRSQVCTSHSENGSSSSSIGSGMALRTTSSSSHSGPAAQVHYRTGGGLSCASSSSCCQSSPSSPAGGGLLAPLIMLRFLDCRVEGAVVKMVGADHRRNHSPCEDVVAWRTPLADWHKVGLFCVFDGHHSRNASEQAQELLPKLLSHHLQPAQQQLQQSHAKQQRDKQQNHRHSSVSDSSRGTGDASTPDHYGGQQQVSQQALLANEPAVAAALTASFLETDQQLTCDDGCTATAVLLEGCADGSVMLRVANVGDSMAVLVDLSKAGWRSLTEDHRIAGNPTEAARLTAKNHNVPGGVSSRLYGLNIARMLGDRFLKEQDVGFSAEPYVSEGVVLGPMDEALLLVASDGLWDVVSQERAAGLAGKTVAEQAGPLGNGFGVVAAGHTAADSLEAEHNSRDAAADRADGAVQSASGGNSTAAAAVAEALMHAALSLRSKDDISIMVLHVLPAAVAGGRAAAGGVSMSGSM